MLQDADFVLPHRTPTEIPAKPPLFHWLGAAVSTVRGDVTEATVGLPSLAASLSIVVFTLMKGASLFNASAAWIAVVILTTTRQWIASSVSARVDMILAAAIAAAMFVFLGAYRSGLRWPDGFWFACALGVLAKGPVGDVLPVACVAVFLSRRPEIMGNFLRALARAKIMIYAVASSRSSISAVMSLEAKDKAIWQLFEEFRFSSFASPAEFFAAQPPPEELVKKAVAVYQESIIKIYYLEDLPDQDLWSLSVPSVMALENFGEGLLAMRDIRCPIPFFLAVSLLGKKELLFSFSTSSDHGDEVRHLLNSLLPGITPRRQAQVAAIFLHGPHFGDRYGIARTFLVRNIPSLSRGRLGGVNKLHHKNE